MRFAILAAVLCLAALPVRAQLESVVSFRAPAFPLVAHDPYFSVWSQADRLTDTWPTHWTGATMALCGMARIDGNVYRFAGAPVHDIAAMEQTGVEVWPTRTVYRFQQNGVELAVTFLSPLLPDDLDLVSRPVTYVMIEARAIDGKSHEVSLYLDVSGEWAVHKPDQEVVWSRFRFGNLDAMRIGTDAQPVLARAGDDRRIDWGYLYLATPSAGGQTSVMAPDTAARTGFIKRGALPANDDQKMPRPANQAWPVLAVQFDLGVVTDQPATRRVLLAYDDLYAIELFGRKLKPYWQRDGLEIGALLPAADDQFADLDARCREFDRTLLEELRRVGGGRYAAICSLAYRTALAGQKLAAGFDGAPLMFPKENHSNGCIATVDVIYPAAPIFLYFNTAMLKAQLKPVLDYAASARWPWPFAPHDLGAYPLANGQVYGGGEKTEENQMPVEESANMLLMLAAIGKIDGNADFAAAWWPAIMKWAEYLREKGLDPENQLCTDDFAGHLAHNANLSIKAILALGSYGILCEMTGRAGDAQTYRALAAEMAQQWLKMADDGDHYRLAFDKPGTWSQKYNLVWDKMLGLNLFPAEVARKEVAHYLRVQNKYGLPLDNRKDYTKLDWLFWSATLAEKRDGFEAIIAPAYAFVIETPDRVPLTDWYDTKTAQRVGFTGRPVIGGLFIKALAEKMIGAPPVQP